MLRIFSIALVEAVVWLMIFHDEKAAAATKTRAMTQSVIRWMGDGDFLVTGFGFAIKRPLPGYRPEAKNTTLLCKWHATTGDPALDRALTGTPLFVDVILAAQLVDQVVKLLLVRAADLFEPLVNFDGAAVVLVRFAHHAGLHAGFDLPGKIGRLR
jgi:hypothetical protein